MTPVTGPPAHKPADVEGDELVPVSLEPSAPWPARLVAAVPGGAGGDVLRLALAEGRARLFSRQGALPPSFVVLRGSTFCREGPEVPAPRDLAPAHPVSESPSDVWVVQLPQGLAPCRTQGRTGLGEGCLPPVCHLGDGRGWEDTGVTPLPSPGTLC